MNRQTKRRTLAVLATGGAMALAGPAAALAAPTAHQADLLGGLTGAVPGATGSGTGSGVTAPVSSLLPAVTSLLGSTSSGGAQTAVVVTTVNSLLGSTAAPPAPTPASLVGNVGGAVSSLQSGNPTGVTNALAGTLSSLVGVSANIPNPDAATTDVQGAVSSLLGGNPQAAVGQLTDLVGQLVGVTNGVLPAGVSAGVQAAVTSLLAGDAQGALNGLAAAVTAAEAAVPGSSAADGGVASFTLPGGSVLGSAVGPVLGGTGALAPGRLFFSVTGAHAAAVGSPHLVVRGARLITHGTKIRVKVSCVGSASQTCSGVVKIHQLTKTIAHSATLRMKGGATKKIVLKVAGHQSQKKSATKATRK